MPGDAEGLASAGGGDEEEAALAEQVDLVLDAVGLGGCHRGMEGQGGLGDADEGDAAELEAFHRVHGGDADALGVGKRGVLQRDDGDIRFQQAFPRAGADKGSAPFPVERLTETPSPSGRTITLLRI